MKSRRAHALTTIPVAGIVSMLVGVTPDSATAQSFGIAFGASTGVVGEHVMVGEPNSVRRPGIVYVYNPAGDGWEEAGRLTASDGTTGDRFGDAIATFGTTMIVGASRADGGRGAAYVFELSDGTWQEVAKLTALDAQPGNALGVSVAIANGLALVGTDDGKLLSMKGLVEGFVGPAQMELDAPAVHAFRLGAGGTWQHAGRLTPDEGEAGIGFGRSLALDGSTAFVGAAKHHARSGAVFVFEDLGDGWTRTGKVEGTAAGAGFGAAVAVMESGRLLVGAPMQDQQQGEVFVYERDGLSGSWTETGRLRPAEGRVAHFGASLSTAGSDVWIGALRGAFATRFDVGAGSWSERTKLPIERTPGTEWFGMEVALGPNLGSVGFPEDDFGAGSGAILTRQGNGWQLRGQVTGDSDAPPAVTGDEVRCQDGVAEGYGCESVDLLAFIPVTDLSSTRGVQVNDIWGWTDPETSHEYALVGRGDGTAFVDVTDPSNPVYVAELPRTAGSPASVWRDIKTYGNYALIVADEAGAHGMQVFDLTRLRDVTEMPATMEPDATYHGFGSSHNIVVNEESGFAYAVTGECGGGLHMVDISDPLNGVSKGCYTRTGNSPLESFTHDSQCVTYHGPDTDYQGRDICFTSGFAGLMISDMTDHENPVPVSLGQFPGSALPHQGWLTEDQGYFLLGDEGDEIQGLVDNTRTLIWDVTDLDDPVLLTEYFGPTKAIDHNMYVRGNLLYQANYDAGLRIVDITNIEQPREVGFFDTVPSGADEASFRAGAWSVYPYFESGVIIVSSGTEGLFILRYRPQEPVS